MGMVPVRIPKCAGLQAPLDFFSALLTLPLPKLLPFMGFPSPASHVYIPSQPSLLSSSLAQLSPLMACLTLLAMFRLLLSLPDLHSPRCPGLFSPSHPQ